MKKRLPSRSHAVRSGSHLPPLNVSGPGWHDRRPMSYRFAAITDREIVIRPATTDADLEAWNRVRRIVMPNEPSRRSSSSARWQRAQTGCCSWPSRRSQVVGSGVADRSDSPMVSSRRGCSPIIAGAGSGRLSSACSSTTSRRVIGSVGAHVDDEPPSRSRSSTASVEVDREVEQVAHVDARSSPPPPPYDGRRVLDRRPAPRTPPTLVRPRPAGLRRHGPQDRPGRRPGRRVAARRGDAPGGDVRGARARDDRRYAGLLAWTDDPTRAENGLTVVDRSWRGRGLATALKRRQLAWAAANGIREIVTWTQEGNEAMQRVNVGSATHLARSAGRCGATCRSHEIRRRRRPAAAYRWRMTRILVTGGAGYVGSVSAEAFLRAGHEVVVLDDLSTGHRGAVPPGAPLHRAHTPTPTRWPACSSPSGSRPILHCAARSLVGESIADPSKYYRDNVAGGVALLEAARAARVERLVFSSTAAVYGDPGRQPDHRGRAAPADQSLRRVEAHVRRRAGLVWPSVRPAQRDASATSTWPARPRRSARTTTPRPTSSRTSSAPPKARRASRSSVTTTRPPTGPASATTSTCSDLADAHLKAIEATAPGDPRTTDALVCNLGNGGGFSVREVLAAAEAVVGRPIPSTVGPRRPGDPPVLVARADRAAEILDWRPARPRPRGDRRLGLGLAPGAPGWLPGLTRA